MLHPQKALGLPEDDSLQGNQLRRCEDLPVDFFANRSLVIAANRGPVTFEATDDGHQRPQRRNVGWRLPSPACIARPMPPAPRLKMGWLTLIADRQAFSLKDKRWALALHARLADHDEAKTVLSMACHVAAELALADSFRLRTGHKFMEVAPRLADKRLTTGSGLSGGRI